FLPLDFSVPVKPESVLRKTHLTVDGAFVPLRLTSRSEGQTIVKDWGSRPGQVMLLPVSKIPNYKECVIVIEPGIEPSEGNIRSTERYEFKIQYYDPKFKREPSVTGITTLRYGRPSSSIEPMSPGCLRLLGPDAQRLPGYTLSLTGPESHQIWYL